MLSIVVIDDQPLMTKVVVVDDMGALGGTSDPFCGHLLKALCIYALVDKSMLLGST